MTTKKKGAEVPQQKDKAVSNAAPAATALKKVQDHKKEADEKKPEAAKTAESPAAIVAGRIERMNKMRGLADKHTHLKAKEQELDEFENTTDGTSSRMQLNNGRGVSFEVTNTEVITEAVKLMRKLLTAKIADSEKELAAFEV